LEACMLFENLSVVCKIMFVCIFFFFLIWTHGSEIKNNNN